MTSFENDVRITPCHADDTRRIRIQETPRVYWTLVRAVPLSQNVLLQVASRARGQLTARSKAEPAPTADPIGAVDPFGIHIGGPPAMAGYPRPLPMPWPGVGRVRPGPGISPERLQVRKPAEGLPGEAPQPSFRKVDQSISFRELPFKVYRDADFRPEASASSGLRVVFIASGNCEMNGSYVHILGAGSCSLTAHQPGDSNFTAARIVDQQFTIAKADQVIDFGELLSPYYGTVALPLYARASSGLPVSLTAAGMCAFSGSFIQIFGPGTCTVIAEQPGNENFKAAQPVTQTFEIAGP